MYARITDPDGNRVDLAGLGFTHTIDTYSHAALGGPKNAQITVRGPRDSLWSLIRVLASDVSIHDEAGAWRWGGYVESVAVSIGALSVGLTIKNIANRIQVTYTAHEFDANGQEQQTQAHTEWLSESDSIAQYGTHEARLPFGDSTDAAAMAYGAVALQMNSYPVDTMEIGLGSGDVAATIVCTGYWETLSRRYYEAASLTSGTTQAASATNMPLYTGSYPASIRLAQRLSLPAGVALAAATFIVQKVGNPTGSLRCEMWQAPTGDDPTTMLGYVDVSLDELPDDEAAPTITLESVSVSSNTATATKTAHGLSVDFDTVIAGADLVYVNGTKKVRTVPDADHFTFDAAGADGTASGTITATTAPDPPPAAPSAITFNFPNAQWPAGYDAFIALSIDAMTVDSNNYVNVSCSPSVPGQGLRQYSLGWTNLDSSIQSLRYSLTLTRESTALIAERIASHAAWLKGTIIQQPSGIYVSPMEDGQSRVGDTIEALLNLGSMSAARLLARVTQERIVIVSPEPLRGDDALFLYDPIRGELQNPNGVPLPKDTCPCGGWADIIGVPKSAFIRPGGNVVGPRIFIEETTYSPKDDRLEIKARGMASVWDIGSGGR